ncbi:hypothetical protein BGW39_003727 [Mortierella sp. 14UC]|nr:hypothetical protein BGW39_003727 [Mortierella sp. 14UC]
MSSSCQDSSPPRRAPAISAPPEISGKPSLSRLEQSTKVARISSETGDISVALNQGRHANSQCSVSSSSPSDSCSPLAVDFPFHFQVQEDADVERALHALKTRRLSDYKQSVYIQPPTKPNLQTHDNTIFPLMEVTEFLDSDAQVMLILGDSGAVKSTFNRYLEHQPWQDCDIGERIPLFINLPALDNPEELWDVKLLITCRTQYLGPDYRNRFAPMIVGEYHQAANHLFQEAVIAPFSKDQIEPCVEKYVTLEPRTWVKKDYMDKLTNIPNLMDLVRNPFLLTLCLEALPNVVQGRPDLSRLCVTRLELYDSFVEH